MRYRGNRLLDGVYHSSKALRPVQQRLGGNDWLKQRNNLELFNYKCFLKPIDGAMASAIANMSRARDVPDQLFYRIPDITGYQILPDTGLRYLANEMSIMLIMF